MAKAITLIITHTFSKRQTKSNPQTQNYKPLKIKIKTAAKPEQRPTRTRTNDFSDQFVPSFPFI
jgi:hypothetical protein